MIHLGDRGSITPPGLSTHYSPREVWADDPQYWDGVSDIGAAINAAIPDAIALGTNEVRLGYLTAPFTSRVYLPSLVSIRGMGRRKTNLTRQWKGGFTNTITLGTSELNWPVAGGLDGSVTGTRYAFRTAPGSPNNCFCVFPTSPLGFGHSTAMWGDVTALTIDLCLDLGESGTLATGQLCGSMNAHGHPMPWWIRVISGPKIRVAFSIADGTDGGLFQIFCEFPVTPVPGLNRFTAQVDIVNASILAWSNRVPATVTVTSGAANFTGVNSVRRLVNNRLYIFKLGADNGGVHNWTSGAIGGGVVALDRTFVGLKLSKAVIYTTSGGAQVRVDAATLNDNKQFFSFESGETLAVMDWRTRTAYPEMQTGSAASIERSFGYVNNATTIPTWSQYNGVSGMTITLSGGHAHWSSAIDMGQSTYFVTRDLELIDGAMGINCIPMGASYPLIVRDVAVRADLAGMKFDFSQVNLQGVDFVNAGRHGIAFFSTSAIMRDSTASAPTTKCESLVWSSGSGAGGNIVVDGMFYNEETAGGGRITKALFDMIAVTDPSTGKSRVRISNAGGNAPLPGSPILRCNGLSRAIADEYRLDNCNFFSSPTVPTPVVVQSGNWVPGTDIP